MNKRYGAYFSKTNPHICYGQTGWFKQNDNLNYKSYGTFYVDCDEDTISYVVSSQEIFFDDDSYINGLNMEEEIHG
jgi:phosphoribosyl-AMP cyclohydrolase